MSFSSSTLVSCDAWVPIMLKSDKRQEYHFVIFMHSIQAWNSVSLSVNGDEQRHRYACLAQNKTSTDRNPTLWFVAQVHHPLSLWLVRVPNMVWLWWAIEQPTHNDVTRLPHILISLAHMLDLANHDIIVHILACQARNLLWAVFLSKACFIHLLVPSLYHLTCSLPSLGQTPALSN